MAPTLVTGGTGTLGRHLVRRLRDAGRELRVLTRRARDDEGGIQFVTGDLLSTEGLDAAVAGVSTIIHCAGNHKDDVVATQNLVNAAARAGRPHLVYISVVGAERVPISGRLDRMMFGYFDMKRKAEHVVMDSGLPWTTLRATQFHDLLLGVLEKLAKLPIVPAPSGVSVQPVDAGEVATRLIELALGRPSGFVPDMAGPRVYRATDLVRDYLELTHVHRPVAELRLPGKAARAARTGALIAPERAVGRRTWERFLADRLSRSTVGEFPAQQLPHGG